MGKPNNVHVKNYRDRKRQMDPDFDKKESWRIEKIRKKRVDTMNAIERNDYRRKARERQRKCRERKKGIYITKVKVHLAHQAHHCHYFIQQSNHLGKLL